MSDAVGIGFLFRTTVLITQQHEYLRTDLLRLRPISLLAVVTAKSSQMQVVQMRLSRDSGKT